MIFWINITDLERKTLIKEFIVEKNKIDYNEENGFRYAFLQRLIKNKIFITKNESENLNEFCFHNTGYEDEYHITTIGHIILKHEQEIEDFFFKKNNSLKNDEIDNKTFDNIKNIKNSFDLNESIKNNKLLPIISSHECYYYLFMFAKSIDDSNRIEQGLAECIWGWDDDNDNKFNIFLDFFEKIILDYANKNNISITSETIFREYFDEEEFQETISKIDKTINKKSFLNKCI